MMLSCSSCLGRARRLAYAMMAEPAEPEVEAARLVYRRAFADVFEELIASGIAAGEFPRQNARATAACVMGALNEGLVGPLAPDGAPNGATDSDEPPLDLAGGVASLIEEITAFCLQAVAARPYTEETRT